MYWNFIIKKTQEALTTIIISTTFISGGVVLAWNKVVVPAIKTQVACEQKETVRLLHVLLDEMQFQKYVLNSGKTPDEINLLKQRWDQNKISGLRKTPK